MDLKRFRSWMYREGYKGSTQGNTIRYLKRVTVDLDTCEEYEISDFLQRLEDKGVSVNNFIKAINRYLTFRGKEYLFKKRPIKGDLDIWIPTEKEAERIQNVEWDSKFITARNRLLLKILFIAGLRREEVRKLTFSDVRDTPSKKNSKVNHFYLHVIGKGSKRRFVDIPKFLRDEILYFRRHHAYSSDFIFDNGKGEPISNTQFGRICREAARKSQVKEFHAHAARHYRAVELDEEDIDLESIRRFLGHESLSTTQLYLRGRRNKTRIDLIKKDRYFKGLQEELNASEVSQGAGKVQTNGQTPSNPTH